MEISPFQIALEAWGNIFQGKLSNDTTITFDNAIGKGTIKGFQCNEYIEVFRFKLNLKQKITSTGKSLSEISSFKPIFFGDPDDNKSLGIDQSENQEENHVSLESFPILTQGVFATNNKDSMSWDFTPNRDIHFISIRIKDTHFKNLINKSDKVKEVFNNDKPYYVFEEFDPIMHGMFWRIFSFKDNETYENDLVHACALHLIAVFFSKIHEREELAESNKYPINTKAVFMARTILKKELNKQIHIDDLARDCGLSASRLRALYKQVFGITIHQFHQNVRLDEARKLLREGEKTMSMIAMDLGFSSASHFSAAFKKQFGYTPREFKEDLNR
ncbi:helix-turn-helix domain-containing protein [Flammeovirga kamogawensis]|uniref:AraC family transcriptional regulator n=1 Tax=Flammeovirga kamogawensis TaxID=373891 RepID=A0ABX8GRF3_9BACT|nr:AraC family transcriptional regulator [Flammeovirga kamogawensis]MBB6462751.1 AraC-like DNA-binding protein [Flammeovirga kamogawensis]QWG06018.1 AraC family transcriptional regulator [Flammeovirga kamogawensis]TRX67849.1 helix-turn-helix domain-containing protein [Flammeovirga kamogawensis]